MMSTSVFRPDIEGLRAVAVLSVLLFHAGVPVRGGFVGVDIFFVISGYLITSLLMRELDETGRVSLVDFYSRRARRLLPAATLVLGLTLVLSQFLAPETMRKDFAGDAAGAATYLANWRFATRSIDYLAEDLGRSPYLHFWSLSVEEQFYLAWPLLMGLAFRLTRRFGAPTRLVLFTFMAALSAASLGWSLHRVASHPGPAFFETTGRIWELGLGAALAILRPSLPNGKLRAALATLGATLLAVSIALANPKSGWPSLIALAPTLGCALVLVAGPESGFVGKILGLPPLVWIGKLSYSAYLWHWPLVVVGQDWLHLQGMWWGMALTLASLIPAYASYRWLETPVRNAEALVANPRYTVSLGLNMSFGIALGGVLLSTLGEDSSSLPSAAVQLTHNGTTILVDPPSAGALALGPTPAKATDAKPQKNYKTVIPSPSLATRDLPRAYAEGCQAKAGDVAPHWCSIGDPEGRKRGVLLGDSKILQYYEAFDVIGKAQSISFRVATKSACPFARARTLRDDGPNGECLAFVHEVIKQLKADPPHFMVTSQVARKALPETDDATESQEALVDGMVKAWQELQAAGTQVVVVMENPHPEGNVYQCLLDHPNDARKCSFDRAKGTAQSAYPTQLAAAKQLSNIQTIDVLDYICPGKRCAPVIGGVLIYRQGSHITNTYARTLAPMLGNELQKALTQAR